jgi:hypothetical protein
VTLYAIQLADASNGPAARLSPSSIHKINASRKFTRSKTTKGTCQKFSV